MIGLLDRLAELAAEGLEWNADFRDGQFTPAYYEKLWPVEMYGLVDAHDELCIALPTLLRIAHAAEAVTAHMGPRSRDFAANNATLAELRSALASLGDTPT